MANLFTKMVQTTKTYYHNGHLLTFIFYLPTLLPVIYNLIFLIIHLQWSDSNQCSSYPTKQTTTTTTTSPKQQSSESNKDNDI
jgi:hypothetical protein